MLNVMLNKFATASSHIGRRAIVIGAGVSGLSAANALADHFEEVIVLERDELPYGYIRIVGYGRHSGQLKSPMGANSPRCLFFVHLGRNPTCKAVCQGLFRSTGSFNREA